MGCNVATTATSDRRRAERLDNRDRVMRVIVIDGHDAVRMGRAGRVATTYALVVAEYLLAAGALYGLAWFLATRPTHDCGDCWGTSLVLGLLLIWGEITLAAGLLAALIILTVRLWRTRTHESPRSNWRSMSVASQAAGWGLVCAAAVTLLSCFSGLAGVVV